MLSITSAWMASWMYASVRSFLRGSDSIERFLPLFSSTIISPSFPMSPLILIRESLLCRVLPEDTLEAQMVEPSLSSASESQALDCAGSVKTPPRIGGVLFDHGSTSLPIRYLTMRLRVAAEW